jgi:hypothetical protein
VWRNRRPSPGQWMEPINDSYPNWDRYWLLRKNSESFDISSWVRVCCLVDMHKRND